MDNLLRDIYEVDPIKLKENRDTLDDICLKVKSYYEGADMGRHMYSEVSSHIYKMEQDQYEYLIHNLQQIHDKFKLDNCLELQKSILKLIDHIKLETCREVDLKHEYLTRVTQKISQNISLQISEHFQEEIKKIEEKESQLEKSIDEKTREIEKQFEKHTAEIDKINGSLISVLGIFGAIIVAFFGGLNLLGSILQNMHMVSMYRLVFISLITITGLFNIIFLLLYCISKLTQKSLQSSCIVENECEQINNKILCMYNKYPLVILFNLISIWFMGTVFILYIFDKYDIIRSIISIFDKVVILKSFSLPNGISIVVIGFFLILILQFTTGTVLRYLFSKHIQPCFNCNKK